MNQDLVRRFCTPPFQTLSDYDERVLAEATHQEVPFEGRTLGSYSWGAGRPVLLVHGWGSRASHLALIARHLARSGYRAIAFDGPAHSSKAHPLQTESNMFEYGRAIAAVANRFHPVHALVAHSFGALCAAFVTAGFAAFSDYRVEVDKLVLMSTPPDLAAVLENFSRNAGMPAVKLSELTESLEEAFDVSVERYRMAETLRPNGAPDTLIMHDSEDEEFAISDVRALAAQTGTRLVESHGLGHQRILTNRTAMAELTRFLASHPGEP